MKRIRCRQEDGFSLLQVLVGLGILAVLVMAISSYTNLGLRQVRSVSLDLDWQILQENVRTAIRNNYACSHMLYSSLNGRYAPAPDGKPIAINQLRVGNQVLARKGAMNGFVVKGIYLHPAGAPTLDLGGYEPGTGYPANYRRYPVSLVIEGERSVKGVRAFGSPKLVSRVIPFEIVTGPTAVFPGGRRPGNENRIFSCDSRTARNEDPVDRYLALGAGGSP